MGFSFLLVNFPAKSSSSTFGFVKPLSFLLVLLFLLLFSIHLFLFTCFYIGRFWIVF